MSRIGRLPIVIPAGVQVAVAEDHVVRVKGPKGEISAPIHANISIEVQDGVLNVTRPDDNRINRSLHGLSRSLINNMVVGVTTGFTKELTMVGTGYRAQKQGNKLVLTVGYSHPVEFVEGNGITFDVPSPSVIVVKGIDKQAVGEIAATIRKVRPPEPYLGKGIKYTNETIRRKEGKAGGKGKK